MIRRFATAGLLVLTSAAVPLVASTSASAACGDNANAQFVHNGIRGFSSWNDICADRIRVTGDYSGLAPQGYYYVSLNFNANCDPAQQFVVGPFRADRHGKVTYAKTVPAGTVDVGAATSIALRHAEGTGRDLDGDGLTGKNDVVAVAGSPLLGLADCDYHI
jgi:hypothetical protein